MLATSVLVLAIQVLAVASGASDLCSESARDPLDTGHRNSSIDVFASRMRLAQSPSLDRA